MKRGLPPAKVQGRGCDGGMGGQTLTGQGRYRRSAEVRKAVQGNF